MSQQKSNSRRKWIWIGGVVLVLVIVAFVILGPVRSRRNQQQQAQANTGDIVTAFIGELSANATASGRVQARRDARLSLDVAGEIAEIFVEVGDTVAADESLLVLDTTDLERVIRSSEQALTIQEANLASLLVPPTAQDLASAEASVASAQAQLDDLLAGPSEDDIVASEANVRAAQANVWAASEQVQLAQSGATESEIASAQAELVAAIGQRDSTQEQYDKLIDCFTFEIPGEGTREICPGLGPPEEQTRFNLESAKANVIATQAKLDALLVGPDADAVAIAQAGLAAASAQRDAAQANHELFLKGASQDQMAAAEANLAQAQANLEALLDGPSTAQIVSAETAVEQARINLQRAQTDLEDATLRAPFAGVVTAIHVNEGEATNGVLVELVDTNSLEVVLEVDEIDVGDLTIGQPADISLETWPDEVLRGEVASIAPQAVNNNSALVIYEVFLGLDDTDLPVLVGMTANADLITAEQEDVLLAPNSAINIDRGSGTYTVNLVTIDDQGNQRFEEVEVSVGLNDGAFTQITSGLAEGDQLLVGDTLPIFRPGEGPPPEGSGFGGGQPRDERPFGG